MRRSQIRRAAPLESPADRGAATGTPPIEFGRPLSLAYLEALWIEARRRAAETEAAYEQLESPGAIADISVHHKARRYHAAVRRLRDALERRVDRLLACAAEVPGRAPLADRYASS